MKIARETCSKVLSISRYLVRAPAMIDVGRHVKGDSKTWEWSEVPVKICWCDCISAHPCSLWLFIAVVVQNKPGFFVVNTQCSVNPPWSLWNWQQRDLVFNKRTQQQSGQRGQCLRDLEEKSLLFAMPCLWLLWSQWEEFSVVKYPGIWSFCLMSQHRFHNVKEQKRAKVPSF